MACPPRRCIFIIVRQARRIHAKFGLSKEDVISFADIMGSAAVPAGDHEKRGLLSGDHEGGGGRSPELLPTAGDEAEVLEHARLAQQVRRGAYDV